MRIDWLKVRNFKGFAEREFNFPRRIDAPADTTGSFHVLIGDNGSGKTSVLDALSVAMGSWLLGLSSFSDACKPRSIHPREARLKRFESKKSGEVRFEKRYPVEIAARGNIGEERYNWTRSLQGVKGRTTTKDALSIKNAGTFLWGRIHKDEILELPLLSYYGAGRVWQQARDTKRRRTVAVAKSFRSRLEGYLDCLEPRSNEVGLLHWLEKQELRKLQEGAPPQGYSAAKEAILACLSGGRSLEFSVREGVLMVEIEDLGTQPFANLSDGYRNMLGMAGDIAFKCALLNPHLGQDAARKTPGIVLIDELDLHLHPNWQRRVVEDLRTTFPNIQFIASTHSPFIVQSLEPGELIELQTQQSVDDGYVGDLPIFSNHPQAEYADQSIEDIAENVMGVDMPQKSTRYLQMMGAAEAYFRLLKSTGSPEEVAAAEERLNELAAPFSDDPAFQALLKVERELHRTQVADASG